jgi:hypothetical protein
MVVLPEDEAFLIGADVMTERAFWLTFSRVNAGRSSAR